MRLVVDASRNLNPFIVDLPVKLSHLEVANSSLIEGGQYMATLDLESGYHQVPIHPDFQKFLGIEWTKNVHLGIWITAILFSALHLQFYGFLPRLALGLGFGYLFYWSKIVLC